MIAIHFRTPKSLELSISAGRHVRHFVAFMRNRRWYVEENRGHEVEILGVVPIAIMFKFFRAVEKNLLTFQKSQFNENAI